MLPPCHCQPVKESRQEAHVHGRPDAVSRQEVCQLEERVHERVAPKFRYTSRVMLPVGLSRFPRLVLVVIF
jgi:hypothetical protein